VTLNNFKLGLDTTNECTSTTAPSTPIMVAATPVTDKRRNRNARCGTEILWEKQVLLFEQELAVMKSKDLTLKRRNKIKEKKLQMKRLKY